MSSTPKLSHEAEDVLQFLNSLPDADKKNAKANTGTPNADNSDIMDFLDELEASDVKKNKKATDKTDSNKKTEKAEAKEDSTTPDNKSDTTQTEQTTPSHATDDSHAADEDNDQEVEQDEEIDTLPDPIASISNWWSSSGSATVSSFWSNAQEIGKKAQEEAGRLATQAKIDEQLKKLQSLHLDEETKKKIIAAGDDMDPGRALDFFTQNISNVFNSMMSTDEVLKIRASHDLENYYVETIISKSFKKVMKQVQGGIAIELVTDTAKDHNKRNLNIFEGKAIDGEKLALANLETAIKDAGAGKAEEGVRSSNLFISIVAIQPFSKDKESDESTITIDSTSASSFHFLIVLKDTTNDISIITKSQAFPLKWATWLDGSDAEKDEDEDDEGVDPSQWVKGWVYDGLALSFGVLAQSYVVKRMGYD